MFKSTISSHILSIQYHLSFLLKNTRSVLSTKQVSHDQIRGFLFKFSASLYFWLGASDQFRSDKKWYWVQTEQNLNSGYRDWYRTEPDNLGTYFFYFYFFFYIFLLVHTYFCFTYFYFTSLDNPGTYMGRLGLRVFFRCFCLHVYG